MPENNNEDLIYNIIKKLNSIDNISQFTKEKMIKKIAMLENDDLVVMNHIVDLMHKKNRKSPYQMKIASIKDKIAEMKKTGNKTLFVSPINDVGEDVLQKELNSMFRD